MNKTRILGILAMVLACFAVAFLMDTPKFLKYKKGDIKDYGSVAAGTLQKGDLIQGTIDVTDGAIAELEESNTTFGIKTSSRTTKRYYALYMYNDMYILYETGNSSEYATLDQLADECEAYYTALWDAYEAGSDDYSMVNAPSTTLDFTGEIKDMPSDLYGIFQEWYGEGFADDCENMVIISRSDFSRFSWVIYAGAGCALLAIVMLVLTIIVARNEKRNQEFSY